MHLGICTGSSYRMPANHPPIPGSYCGWDRKVSKYSIYIYIHIYTVDIYSIFMYIIILFFCFYIYILCINIYFLYIYTYKNIITYIDSYRSASKTLSLGFQVRKKKFFFHGPFDGDMPVRGLKSCRGLSQFCLWKGFQIRFWYGRRSDHTD